MTMSEYFEFHMNKRYENGGTNYIENHKKIASNQDQRNQQHILQLFKDIIGASVNLALKDKSCCSDDSFLNRFLYARKFNCEEALNLLISYMTFKENNKTILQKMNIFNENIQLALRDGNPAVLNQRDRRGRKVIAFAACNWDPSKYSAEDIFRALLFTIDKLLENIQNQALGFVIIVDWTNFTFKQSTNLSPKILKLMIEGLQNCMPVKFKGVHFISQPWYVEVALTVIKPFFTDKIKERFITHGTNLTTLHNLVSKDILPPDLGGEGPSINTLDWYHYVLESSQTSESPRSYRLIEAQVYTKAPHLKNNIVNTMTQNDFSNEVNHNQLIS